MNFFTALPALALSLTLLVGCAGQAAPAASSPSPGDSAPVSPAAASDTGYVFFVGETPFLYLEDGMLASLPTLAQGMPELHGGELLRVDYGGYIMESYPCQFGDVTALTVVERGPDKIALWMGVLADLMATDSALNDDIEMLCFDLEKSGLTPGQKSALTYAASCTYDVSTPLQTYESLVEQGHVDPENPYFENGLLISLEVFDETDNTLSFHMNKWRSALGAYFFHNCKATLSDGSWSYTVGEHMIS